MYAANFLLVVELAVDPLLSNKPELSEKNQATQTCARSQPILASLGWPALQRQWPRRGAREDSERGSIPDKLDAVGPDTINTVTDRAEATVGSAIAVQLAAAYSNFTRDEQFVQAIPPEANDKIGNIKSTIRHTPMTPDDLGFSWRQSQDGAVLISFKGRIVTTLKKDAASAFLAEADGASSEELQQLLARLTGQFKHGNERIGKDHPRNRFRGR